MLNLTTAAQAKAVKKTITLGIRTVKQLIDMTEELIEVKKKDEYYVLTQRKTLQEALDIQLEILRPYNLLVLAHLKELDSNAFSKKNIGEFSYFMSTLENLLNIPRKDLNEHWGAERNKLKTVWGIAFNAKETRHTENEDSGSEEEDDAIEEIEELPPKKKKTEGKMNEDAEFDKDRKLSNATRKKILAAGTGDKVEIKKSFPAYLEANFNTKATKKFTGEDPKVGLLEIWLYLQKIHLAPVENVSYGDKIEAVLFCLEGKAEKRVISMKHKTRRIDYLNLWRLLFIIFGDSAAEIARQEANLQNATAKSNDIVDVGDYITELNTALEILETKGEETRDKYINAWGSILAQVREWFEKFVSDHDRSYFDEFNSTARDYYLSDPKGKFVRFRDFIYHRESELRTSESNVKMGIFKAAIKVEREKETEASPHAKREEKEDGDRKREEERRSRKRDRSPENERRGPPAKKKEPECFICLKNHLWHECPKTIDEKEQIFKKYNLCPNCGQKGHKKSECRTRNRCFHCPENLPDYKRKHHSSICYEKYGYPKNYLEERARRGREHERQSDRHRSRRDASPSRGRREEERRTGGRGRSRSPRRDNRGRRTPERERELRKRIEDLEKQLKTQKKEESSSVKETKEENERKK